MSYDESRLQYLTDANGKPTAVVVPIDVWEDMQEERDDTTYLMASPVMMQRLKDAMASNEGTPADEIFKMLDDLKD